MIQTYKVICARPDLWSVANAMRTWDEGLFRHSVSVADLAVLVARELGFSEREVGAVQLGGFLHDFGKTTWPKCLISKQELSSDDIKIVQVHPLTGAALVKEHLPSIEELVLRIIEEHHEKPDGTGYPRALKEIGPLSRVVSAVECFVALTEERPYRSRTYTPGEAVEIALSGGFDSKTLGVVLKLLKKKEEGVVGIVGA
ncbi:MAG: HD domain-containing protein [Firmicutes bacterium]|nr:HD domain-containing protein [Bacillota bacterium]